MRIFTLSPQEGAEHCDGHVCCFFVCVFVSVFVCLSASIYPVLHFRSLPNFMHVIDVADCCLCYSVLLWRRCDTLCTSGFIDDVMFAHNGQE